MAGVKTPEEDSVVIPDGSPGYDIKYFCIPNHYKDDLESVLVPRGLVLDRTEKIASDIYNSIDFTKPLIALCVLKGGYIFFNDLLHQLRQLSAHSNRSIQMSVDFIRLKSYTDDRSSGEVKVIGGDNLENTEGKNVLIVEDIIDTGRTMEKLLSIIKPHKPNSVRVAAMVIKRTERRKKAYCPDYVGFCLPDKFIVGYGLDYNEYFRDLSHICVMKDSAKHKYSVKS